MDQNFDQLGDDQVLQQIEALTRHWCDFWKNADGWAPPSAAALLNRSMLEWQASLSISLKQWRGRDSDGDLILAWANLGSLAEGAMKLLLAVFYEDYIKDSHAPLRTKDQNIIEPDELMLGKLCEFFGKRIWDSKSTHAKYLSMVMERRNAIHAFKNRDIGTYDDFRQAVRSHLALIERIESHLPYP